MCVLLYKANWETYNIESLDTVALEAIHILAERNVCAGWNEDGFGLGKDGRGCSEGEVGRVDAGHGAQPQLARLMTTPFFRLLQSLLDHLQQMGAPLVFEY